MSIVNTEGQMQSTILKEDFPGFLFESNRGTKHSFKAGVVRHVAGDVLMQFHLLNPDLVLVFV